MWNLVFCCLAFLTVLSFCYPNHNCMLCSKGSSAAPKSSLASELAEMKEELQHEKEILSQVLKELGREKPHQSLCAGRSEQKGRGTITYKKLFHDSSNIKEGGLNISSGIFTAGVSGTYAVSWSAVSSATGLHEYTSVLRLLSYFSHTF